MYEGAYCIVTYYYSKNIQYSSFFIWSENLTWQFYRDKEMNMVGCILYGYNTDGQGLHTYKGLIVEELMLGVY